MTNNQLFYEKALKIHTFLWICFSWVYIPFWKQFIYLEERAIRWLLGMEKKRSTFTRKPLSYIFTRMGLSVFPKPILDCMLFTIFSWNLSLACFLNRQISGEAH